MSTQRPITIDVVSDVVCPWCYVGKRRLAKALTIVPDVSAAVRWHPFQLDPTIPAEGVDRKAYLERKFGSGGRLAEMHVQLAAAGAEVGIAFAFERITRSPNTLTAHRLIHWAAGDALAQDALVERLFALYFEEGSDLGDRQVLADAADDVGLDRADAERLIAGDDELVAVRGEINAARQAGITGVPCFIIDGRYAVMGAQQPAILADVIQRSASPQPS
ncbi:DsbA family oxidoreductase [Rhodoligotrophos defluvii]|uniref:DsbA family oxidoreductase n=1 Tax=Rhodoligotrophos defluvii TaxID=2561934 RepID=UPI0010C98CF1|nr:DsbA family oxidoreductase [Rhodoligotrophos defluvii]